MSILTTALSFSNAGLTLIEHSVDKFEKKIPMSRDMLELIANLVTITSIIAISIHLAANEDAPNKAVVIGSITWILVDVLPRLLVKTTIDKYCGSCTPVGKFSSGFMFVFVCGLLALAIRALFSK